MNPVVSYSVSAAPPIYLTERHHQQRDPAHCLRWQ